MKKIHDVAVVILSAGLSTRMHSSKAFLPFDAHSTFIGKIIELYFLWGCGKIVAVVNKEMDDIIRKSDSIPQVVSIVVNEHIDYGRFYSVKLGLTALNGSEFCFIQNVDNPFIDNNILNALYENRSPEAFVLPVFQKNGGHPVLLNRKNMEYIRNYPLNNVPLKVVLNAMECKKVEMHNAKALININSPEEYKRFFNK
ncbi:MAG: NTP transferase domain-containing protein [Bacteroidota bacterium]